MTAKIPLGLAVVCGLLLAAPALRAETAKTGAVAMPHITGIGGIFFKAKDPKALAAWYRDVLGMPVEKWGGAMLRYDAPGHPPLAVWNAFPEKTDYFGPSTREFMINYAVDDLDGFLAMLKGKGVNILKRDDSDPNGSFAWILDPEGTKIELWQPKGK
jgi:catechol 2,3-dioxygenase-like lactoylglutathione lyase family enzyme